MSSPPGQWGSVPSIALQWWQYLRSLLSMPTTIHIWSQNHNCGTGNLEFMSEEPTREEQSCHVQRHPAQGSKVSWPTKPHNVCSNNFRIRHVMTMFTHNSQLGSPESRGCEPTGGNWWTLAASWNGRWSQWMSMTLSSSSNLCHWHSLPLQCQWLD